MVKPENTSYPIEQFPSQGYKLLIDFLVKNLHFPEEQQHSDEFRSV